VRLAAQRDRLRAELEAARLQHNAVHAQLEKLRAD
jgi:hypothetical protein